MVSLEFQWNWALNRVLWVLEFETRIAIPQERSVGQTVQKLQYDTNLRTLSVPPLPQNENSASF